jgi:hypothetical protein
MNHHDDEPLIDTSEAGAIVNVRPKQIRYLVKKYPERFRVYRIGRKIRFKRSELLAAFRTEPIDYAALGRLHAHDDDDDDREGRWRARAH